jgi:DNA gyrase subunit A
MGRTARGVIGMRVQYGDEVVSAFAVDKSEIKDTSILTVTVNGYGKRTPLSEYRITNRGVKGVRNMKVVSKNGPVVTSMPVPIEAGDSNMSLVNSDGTLIKVRINGIRNMGRSTQGVKVMRIQGEQRLIMASSVIDEGEEAEIEEDEEDLAEIAKDEASKLAGEDEDFDEESEDETTDPEGELDDEQEDIDLAEFEKYVNDSNNE